MIWRLEYCNKFGDTARLDIQRGASTPIEVIEGADNPFSLKYKLDASNKTGYFMSSSAEISIFETATFNIDELKTSNETELKVNYYVNSDLKWTGFILPDFFSRVIGEPAIVEMTATDRLGTLKGVTLTGLTAKVTLRSLLEQSLLKTGISLPVQYDAQISESGTNVFDTEILSQRIVDTRGRNISCYDIIKSILVATNSTIRQRDGKWQIYNKLEHESVAPSITFNEVEKGARRTIQPVASSVGIFQELGGGQIYPDNYNFINGLSDWALGGSSPSFVPENRNVMGYTTGGMPIYGDSGFFSIRGYNSADPVLVTPETNPHIKSNPITIQTNDAASVKVNVDVNATGQNIATNIFTVIVFAEKVGEKLAIDQSGFFTKYSSDINKVGQFYHNVVIYDKGKKNIDAVTVNNQISGVLTADNVNDYKITVLITGTWLSAKTVFINSVATTFSSTVDTTKGNIFKTNQGVNFTREHEIDTTIFGDYIARGINGYFYKYMPDDTSSLMLTDGSFTDLWTAFGSSEQLPLLQHMTRQKSKMFSIAHDILSATIEAQSFDPLAIYQSCDGEKWVIIEANYDFLRSNVDVVLEQIKYGALEKRDYIYSYFGDGETGVKSIGGISAGASGGASIDSGLIGGINERIDDVNDKVNNIKVGPANLLLNTGFLGDFQSLTVDALTAVTGSTPINTNPLVHWVYSNTEVIDAPSRSGKGVKIGSIQQTVTLKQGSHVLSFWAKGNSLTVDLVESVPVSIDSEYKKYSFDITVATSGAHTFSLSGDASIYEIMLSEGNAEVSYSYSEADDLKAIAQLQAINVITDAIKNYDTDILGGLILTSMIQLGKYKDGVMEKVNAGISGIYNNDNDPAVWAGGTMEMAIRTVQKFIANPNYQPTEAEWAEMAKIVFTHGGDGFFRGYIYALGGFFRGRIESNVSGNRIIVNPENRSIEMINSQNRLSGQIFFSEGSGWGAVQFYDYHSNGTLKTVAALDLVNGVYFSEYADGNPVPVKITYSKNGQIQNGGIPSMTDAQADTLLVSGEWYRDGRTLKIKP